jgi:hypothetical protein
MIRSTRLNLMTMIVRAGADGYYTRGHSDGFVWLRENGLAEWVNQTMLTHRLTNKGRALLREQGICDKCGGHGTYRVNDPIKPWAECDCTLNVRRPWKQERAELTDPVPRIAGPCNVTFFDSVSQSPPREKK